MNKKDKDDRCDNATFEHQFFATLMRMNGLLRNHIEQEMATVNVSPAQIWFLKRLYDAGAPQPISFFADGIRSNRSNATQMIDRIEAEGLVRRIKNPHDRRSVLVEMTDLGLQRLKEGHEHHEKIVGKLLAPLTEEEREETIKVFDRISTILDNN